MRYRLTRDDAALLAGFSAADDDEARAMARRSARELRPVSAVEGGTAMFTLQRDDGDVWSTVMMWAPAE